MTDDNTDRTDHATEREPDPWTTFRARSFGKYLAARRNRSDFVGELARLVRDENLPTEPGELYDRLIEDGYAHTDDVWTAETRWRMSFAKVRTIPLEGWFNHLDQLSRSHHDAVHSTSPACGGCHCGHCARCQVCGWVCPECREQMRRLKHELQGGGAR